MPKYHQDEQLWCSAHPDFYGLRRVVVVTLPARRQHYEVRVLSSSEPSPANASGSYYVAEGHLTRTYATAKRRVATFLRRTQAELRDLQTRAVRRCANLEEILQRLEQFVP